VRSATFDDEFIVLLKEGVAIKIAKIFHRANLEVFQNN
jgi:hypothetical protein